MTKQRINHNNGNNFFVENDQKTLTVRNLNSYYRMRQTKPVFSICNRKYQQLIVNYEKAISEVRFVDDTRKGIPGYR